MKTLMLLCCLFLLSGMLKAQPDNRKIENFCGHWKGELEWHRPGKATQKFSMQLKISKTDTIGIYNWQIIYGDSGKDVRPYTLKPVNDAIGHWVIDENNGIVLDNFFVGNCITGSFTVMGNTIVNNYCLENEKLNIEFVSMKLADKKSSGKGTNESPVVESYRITGLQKGMLLKLKP
jgi:hypothetical protein